jgi:hypothetical protein
MKEHPILFSGAMVRAILEGRKTMTRRVIKEIPTTGYRWGGWIVEGARGDEGKATVVPEGNSKYCGTGQILARCPYGQPGDRLWVRETWHCPESLKDGVRDGTAPRTYIEYRADMPHMIICDGGWTPSLFMPRWASRILLEITAIRVERVQDISDQDAEREGVDITNASIPGYCRERFRWLWDSINAKRGFGWDANPWVWVVEFKRVGA